MSSGSDAATMNEHGHQGTSLMKRLLLLSMLSVSVLLAQDTGKLSGRIVDAKTREPIPSANVMIRGTALGATTDLEGRYFILRVPPGKYEVAASMVGYGTLVVRGVQIDLDRTTEQEFRLSEEAVQAGTVEIVAVRPDVEREKTSTSDIVRSEEVMVVPAIRDLSSLLSLEADVVDGHFRGGREGEELYNLSGMGIVNPLNSSAAFAPIVSAVEEVEVITSGFSAQYGNAQSGVVNISMKEGRPDRWAARAEVRTRLPGYKHFGASIFDEKANPYLQVLNSPQGWLGIDSSATSLQMYYETISYGFKTAYPDPVQAAQIAYSLWKQARRDLNRRYDNTWDYSVEGNIGGPLSERARMFLAMQVENEWPVLPTPEPDVNRQLMGNVTYDVAGGLSLRLSGTYSSRNGHLLPGLRSSNYSNFYNWLWDRVIGLPNLREDNGQIGVRMVYASSNSTMYEMKVNYLSTAYADGVKVASPDRYVSDDLKLDIWSYYNTPDGFRLGQMDNDFRDEKTKTFSVDASITSQLSFSHLLLAGLQFNSYAINVNNQTTMSTQGNERLEVYRASPYELGIYAQDKMEFQGMIANVGLRLDVYNQNVDFYTDQFSPFRIRTSDTSWYYDPALAHRQTTPVIGRLQPRVGISFPVSVSTVFHLNYGSFMQRPSFERTVYLRLPRENYNSMTLGNPLLKPQDTKSYDVGLMQALGEGFTLDVSGYYKDVKNLIQRAFYYDQMGTSYSTFVNRDYADIRGFSVKLVRHRGIISGSLKYNYGVATGKSGNAFLATPVYKEEPSGGVIAELPSPKDIVLDFDRTHNLILNLNIATPESWGPDVLGTNPLENFTVSVNSFARSGRPYTYDMQGLGLINNKRSPAEYNTNLKISRKLPRFFGTTATVYMEVLNVFNQRIYSFNPVFGTGTVENAANTITNQNVSLYEQDPDLLRYYSVSGSFLVDQTFLLYGNSPRSYYIGLALNF